MHEEGKQPQLPEDKEYRKLFGLDIYLTPVFVIASIAIVVSLSLGHSSFKKARQNCLEMSVSGSLRTLIGWFMDYHVNLLVCLFCLILACFTARQDTPRRSRCET